MVRKLNPLTFSPPSGNSPLTRFNSPRPNGDTEGKEEGTTGSTTPPAPEGPRTGEQTPTQQTPGSQTGTEGDKKESSSASPAPSEKSAKPSGEAKGSSTESGEAGTRPTVSTTPPPVPFLPDVSTPSKDSKGDEK